MTYTTLISLLKCTAILLGTAILKTILSWYASLHNRTILRGYIEKKKKKHLLLSIIHTRYHFVFSLRENKGLEKCIHNSRFDLEIQ